MDDQAISGSATIRIDTSAADVFAVLTDLEQLPTFSPENVRCEFLGDATQIEVGVRFRGYNKMRDYEWHVDCVVTQVKPHGLFEYEVPPDFDHATVWRYEVTPDGGGCVVTESFVAPLLGRADLYPGRVEGRRDNLERACETTLANLKAAIEAR